VGNPNSFDAHPSPPPLWIDQPKLVYPEVMPRAALRPTQHIQSVGSPFWWLLALMPSVVAVRTRGDDVVQGVPPTLTSGCEVFGRAANPLCSFAPRQRAGQLRRMTQPHHHAAVEASTGLLLECERT